MSLTEIQLDQFTTFDRIVVDCSPGINVFIGENGTGKTHLLKVAYAACDVSKSEVGFAEKLNRVFLPTGRVLGRLVKRKVGRNRCLVKIHRRSHKLEIAFGSQARGPESAKVVGAKAWSEHPIQSVYIPVKEMLSNAPGFLSLYKQREIHFEEVYADILYRAYRPPPRGQPDASRRAMLGLLRKRLQGRVVVRGEEFLLANRQGNLEFTLLAEGIRKLALLWLLINNGVLLEGSVLFWDEPEANLNPSLFGTLIKILLLLQRRGVQVFLATHDYVILKEIDLQTTCDDRIAYHALYRDAGTDGILCQTTERYLDLAPNAIADTFDDLYDREVTRSMDIQR